MCMNPIWIERGPRESHPDNASIIERTSIRANGEQVGEGLKDLNPYVGQDGFAKQGMELGRPNPRCAYRVWVCTHLPENHMRGFFCHLRKIGVLSAGKFVLGSINNGMTLAYVGVYLV